MLPLPLVALRDLEGGGLCVNTITPGYTMTEASKTLFDPETFAGVKQRVLDRQIIKRARNRRT
jgi:NAD(P)-dependent dehydrogenase (short-subunit alcohol dehydrogenase family)